MAPNCTRWRLFVQVESPPLEHQSFFSVLIAVEPREPILDELLAKLGRHTKGSGCLYIKKLADVEDVKVLETLVRNEAGARPSLRPPQSPTSRRCRRR